MGCAGEEVGRLGGLEGVAPLGEQLHVPGQGGRVAGDVDQAAGGHVGDGLDDRQGQALPGRVHGDDLRAQAPGGQGLGGFAGVGAEEFRVRDAVAQGVGLGVLDGGGDHLRPDGPGGPAGQVQGDGADAAVEVQHGLPPRQPRQVQDPAVEDLCLVPVHLVKGGHRQAEGQPAQGVLQKVLAPEQAELLAQNHVGLVLIDGQNHPHQAGLRLAQGVDERLLPGQGRAVGDHRAQRLAPAVHPDVKMPDEPLVGFLVVGGDVVLCHPVPKGLPQAGGGQGLEQAVRGVDDVVAAGPEEAHPGPLGHGKLDLVAVAEGVPGPVDHSDLPVPAADAPQGVLDLLPLEGQLLGIGHVPQLAAPALGVLGAVGGLAAGGGLHNLGHPPPGGGLTHL